MHWNILSQQEAGKGCLAQAFVLEAHMNLFSVQLASCSCTMAEAKGNYSQSKAAGLEPGFLTLTHGFYFYI